MADKVCYGQPYILKDQLIQDTVTFSEGGQVYNGTNVVIEDIWEDLMADSHQYKQSGKNSNGNRDRFFGKTRNSQRLENARDCK